jgi:hypothetical protein
VFFLPLLFIPLGLFSFMTATTSRRCIETSAILVTHTLEGEDIHRLGERQYEESGGFPYFGSVRFCIRSTVPGNLFLEPANLLRVCFEP